MYKEFLQDINTEIDRQSAIVNDLLTLVRLEENEQSLNVKKFSLNELAEDILKRLKPLADRRNIELLLDTVRDVTIEADEMKLTMALSNLIENGIKYNVEMEASPSRWIPTTKMQKSRSPTQGLGSMNRIFPSSFTAFTASIRRGTGVPGERGLDLRLCVRSFCFTREPSE